MGQFDIYPQHKDVVRLQKILSSHASAQSVSNAKERQNEEERKSGKENNGKQVMEEVQPGCFLVKNVLNLHF